jgi:hypothetical protein
MPYTAQTIRRDLSELGVSSWDWAGNGPRAQIDLRTGKAPVQSAAAQIGEYCWCAYDKAFRAAGDEAVGRVNHLNAAGLYEKVSDIVGKETLFSQGTQGNLLRMDKWARVVNDSWILGGVHRGAKFRLTSPRVMENLWNYAIGAPVVTGREILGLLHFGYQLQQIGPWQVFVLADRSRATPANLVEYDRLMSSQGTIANLLKLVDKGKLPTR